MKRIEIVVAQDGSSTVETKGFAGSSCKEASRFLEQSLGRPKRERLTAEFHQTVTEVHEQQRKQA